MPQEWTYYVPLLLHNGEGGIGFTFRFAHFERRLDEDLAWSAIMKWTEEILGVVPQDKDNLPLVPLGWDLFSGKQGPGVEPLKPKGNGH